MGSYKLLVPRIDCIQSNQFPGWNITTSSELILDGLVTSSTRFLNFCSFCTKKNLHGTYSITVKQSLNHSQANSLQVLLSMLALYILSISVADPFGSVSFWSAGSGSATMKWIRITAQKISLNHGKFPQKST